MYLHPNFRAGKYIVMKNKKFCHKNKLVLFTGPTNPQMFPHTPSAYGTAAPPMQRSPRRNNLSKHNSPRQSQNAPGYFNRMVDI